MSEKKKKSDDERGLVKKKDGDGQELTAEQILSHPIVRQMNQKIEEMRQMVQGIPEAVGRGVAEAMRDLERKRVPKGAVGPPVPLRPFGGTTGSEVEFHKGGKVVERPLKGQGGGDSGEAKEGS